MINDSSTSDMIVDFGGSKNSLEPEINLHWYRNCPVDLQELYPYRIWLQKDNSYTTQY